MSGLHPILVTGAGGGVGRKVVEQLCARRMPVRAFVHHRDLPTDTKVPGAIGSITRESLCRQSRRVIRTVGEATLQVGMAKLPHRAGLPQDSPFVGVCEEGHEAQGLATAKSQP